MFSPNLTYGATHWKNRLPTWRLRGDLTPNGLANCKHRGGEQMASKFVSCCMGRANRLRFFVCCTASVLVALQTFASGAGSAAIESLTGNEPGPGNLAATASTASSAPEERGQVTSYMSEVNETSKISH